MVGAVAATHAAKDDAGAAAGQCCAIVVEKIVAQANVEIETLEVVGYMEGVSNEMDQEDCCVLHPHLGQVRSVAVGTIAALGCTEVGVPVISANWETVVVGLTAGDKCC